MGRDAAHTSLKTILPGSEYKSDADRQRKTREGRGARGEAHNASAANHSAAELTATGGQLQKARRQRRARATGESEVYPVCAAATPLRSREAAYEQHVELATSLFQLAPRK